MLNDIMSSLGSSIVLPIFIFLFALCFKVKPGTSFKSAIFIGIGLIGISMVLDFFTAQVTDVVNLMVETTGINLPYLDVSWGVAATVAYSTSVGLLIIPFCLAVNIVVILLKGRRSCLLCYRQPVQRLLRRRYDGAVCAAVCRLVPALHCTVLRLRGYLLPDGLFR